MTNFEYEEEISRMLNGINPGGRKVIEADLIYVQAIRQNDWAAAHTFVYEWINGTAKAGKDLKEKLAVKRALTGLADLI